MNAVIGLTGARRSVDGLKTSSGTVTRIALPRSITPDEFSLVQRDAEVLASLLRDRPDDMIALMQAAMKRDLSRARELARGVGLNEERFKSMGGGLIWWVVAAVVVVTIVVTEGEAGGDEDDSEMGDFPTDDDDGDDGVA